MHRRVKAVLALPRRTAQARERPRHDRRRVRVLIVDDQPPFRDAAKVVFDLLDHFDVVGEATSGEEALGLVAALRPDLVVMDINLPGMNGVDATREIPRPIPTPSSCSSRPTKPTRCHGRGSSGALAYVHKEHLDADLVEELWDERSTAACSAPCENAAELAGDHRAQRLRQHVNVRPLASSRQVCDETSGSSGSESSASRSGLLVNRPTRLSNQESPK